MKKRVFLKRMLSVILTAVLFLSNALPAFAGTSEPPKESEEKKVFHASGLNAKTDASLLAGSDDLLSGYLEKELKERMAASSVRGTKSRSVKSASVGSQGAKLSGNDYAVYAFLMEKIEEVASGNSESTAFCLPLSVLNEGKLEYSAEELGYSIVSDEAVQNFIQKFQFDISKVAGALMSDCPYSLYWYDKTSLNALTVSGFDIYGNSSCLWVDENAYMTVSLMVSADYSKSGNAGTTEVNTAITSLVNSVVSNAQGIVAEAIANGCNTDYKKLVYYRDWISSHVSYNHEANPNGNYGNPWQLIWVFDNDASTNVVCEGYSKAFKWLCDLTSFDDSRIGCILVTGDLYENGALLGGHMWNIVRMNDGQYYMADITNYDGDGNGDEPVLFLGGYTSYENGLYRFNLSNYDLYNHYLCYKYDDGTLSGFSSEELGISHTPYTKRYTVTFDANGHGVAPQPISGLELGTSISVPEEPQAAGYSFGGWYKNATCTEIWDFDTMRVNSDVTLYAKWTRVEHTVLFRSNTSDDRSYTQTVLDSTATALTANWFTNPGNRFLGWNTEEDGSGAAYSDGEAVNLITDLTLYAQWEEITADAPIIVSQPDANVILSYGDAPTTLSVSAIASNEKDYTLHYQWYMNDAKSTLGSSMLNETGSELTVPADTVGTMYYYCVVTAKRKDNAAEATATSQYITVEIRKATPGILSAPKAINGLIYSKSEQELIESGSVDGGTLLYSLSVDGNYSEAIPKGMDAGVYTVFYKIMGDGNYSDTDVLGSVTAEIEQRSVTVSNILAKDKIYDKSTEATLDCTNASFANIMEGDVLSVSATGVFDDAAAGTDKRVSITKIVLAGNGLGNYKLASNGQQSVTYADISPRPIKVVNMTVDDKVYDGSESAADLWHDVITEGICPGDSVTVLPSDDIGFVDKNVGNNKEVNWTEWVIRDSDNVTASNYMISDESLSVKTASITPKPVRIGNILITPKAYDGNKTAQFTFETDKPTIIEADNMNASVVSGDDVYVSGGKAEYEQVNAGEGIPVTFSEFALLGEDKDNYELISQPASVTGTITAKTIIPEITVVGSYTYNGTARVPAVAVKDGTVSLTETDYEVVCQNCVNAGTHAAVIKCKTSGNYLFDDAEITFSIEKAPLVITADNKTRKKGNPDPEFTATVSGLFGEDVLDLSALVFSTSAAQDSEAGSYDITVICNAVSDNYKYQYVDGILTVVTKDTVELTVTQQDGTYGTALLDPVFDKTGTEQSCVIRYRGVSRDGNVYALNGDKPEDAGNYVVEVTYENDDTIYFGTKEFVIAPYDISSGSSEVTLGAALTYDGSELTQSISAIVINGVSVSISDFAVTGNTATNAGDYTLTLTAKETGNYTGSIDKAFSVSKRIVTVSGISAIGKTYDGTKSVSFDYSGAVMEDASTSDPVSDGTISISALGEFSDANVGNNIQVNITSLVILGTNSGNYQVSTLSQSVAYASITPMNVSPEVFVTGTYTYNGSVIEPDIHAIVDAEYFTDFKVEFADNKNAGKAKAVVSPKTDSNYTFSPVTVSFTIEKAPLTVAGGIQAIGKEYNGSDGVTLNTENAVIIGLAACDAGKIKVTATGRFAEVNAGTGKRVLITGISLQGDENVLKNYRLAENGHQAESTADISPKPIVPTVSVSGVYTYNGSEIIPDFTVWDEDTNLPLSSGDYEYSVSDNKEAGSASITVTEKDGGNYTFSEVIETFTINRSPVTVKADDKEWKIGNDEPKLTITITGLLGRDDPTKISCTIQREGGDLPGIYPIHVSGENNQDNYVVTYIDGIFTASEKTAGTLNVTQNDATYLVDALSEPSYTKPSGTKKTKISYKGTLYKDGSGYLSTDMPTEAGDYKVEVICETEDSIFTGSDTFSIKPADLSEANLSVDYSVFTYDGSSHFPLIQSFSFGGENIPDNAYSVSGTGGVLPGNAYKLEISAEAASNYTGSFTMPFSVEPRPLKVTGLSVSDKEYDGTTKAVITGTAAINDICAVDAVSLTIGTASFADKNAGTGKTVILSGFSLNGPDAECYMLSEDSLKLYADIIPKALKVTGITAQDKEYDGNSDALMCLVNALVDGLLSGDDITLEAIGKFSDENVGNNKNVTITKILLSGTDSGNYFISAESQNSTVASILEKSVSENTESSENVTEEKEETEQKDETKEKAVTEIKDLTQDQKPSEKNNLKEDGSAQPLVTEPKEIPGYTVEYSIDGKNWSSTVPTATKSGIYTVQVRYKGNDEKHADFTGETLTVIISGKYAPTEAKGEWTKGSGKKLAYRFKKTYNDEECFEKFTGTVEVDGKATRAGKDFTAEKGSTIITFSAEFLETLSVGSHTVRVVFTDGEASATLSIVAALTPDTSPVTGDSGRPTVWALFALLSVTGFVWFAEKKRRKA